MENEHFQQEGPTHVRVQKVVEWKAIFSTDLDEAKELIFSVENTENWVISPLISLLSIILLTYFPYISIKGNVLKEIESHS